MYETIELLCEGPCADEYLVRNTLSPTTQPQYRLKAEDLSLLHVLLVWGINLASLLI